MKYMTNYDGKHHWDHNLEREREEGRGRRIGREEECVAKKIFTLYVIIGNMYKYVH